MEQKTVLFESDKEAGLPALPDYDSCLVNFAGSVIRHFGVKSDVKTIPMADRYLEKDRKNVVVLLLDAMGISIIEKHLAPDGFFRSHLAGSYSSVFPPTTVAATTSILSAQYPSEHSWLGWDGYYPQLDKNVTVYLNIDQRQEVGSPFSRGGIGECPIDADGHPSVEEPVAAADYHVAGKYNPFEDIVTKIRKAGTDAFFSSPHADPPMPTVDDVLGRIKSLCDEPGKKFIYAYWNEPDHTMHLIGTVSPESHEMVVELEKKVEELVQGLSDTLFFITADHGHMDSENICILDHPEIMKCLVRMPSIEPRVLNLFIKDEYKEEFPALFKKEFGDRFALLKKDEVIAKKLFGPGTEHPNFRGMLGDYLAIAISDLSIFNTHKEMILMPGGHAGLTKEELEIPLIAIECE